VHLRFRRGFSLLNAIAHHHSGLAKDIGWYDAQQLERFPYLLGTLTKTMDSFGGRNSRK